MEDDKVKAGIETLKAELAEKMKDTPYVFLDDEKRVNTVLMGLVKRRETKGEYYCPCRVVSGDPDRDRKIICPCAFMADDIERDGKCFCSLFVKG